MYFKSLLEDMITNVKMWTGLRNIDKHEHAHVSAGVVLFSAIFDLWLVEPEHSGQWRQRPTCTIGHRELHMGQAAITVKREDSPERASVNGWTWPKDNKIQSKVIEQT